MDKIDTDILEILLYTTESLTSVDIVKELYCIETRQEMLRYVNKISYRLNKLIEMNFILVENNSKNKTKYKINQEKIKKGNAILKINDTLFELGDSCVILLNEGQILFLYSPINL